MNIRPLLSALAAAAILACTLAAAPALAGPGHEHRQLRAEERLKHGIYRAWFPDLATARKAAISLHGQLLEAEYSKGYLVLELDGADIARLATFGFRIEPDTDFIARRNAFLDQLDAAERKPGARAGIQSIPSFACYETVEETFAAAQAFTVGTPTLATWIDAGDSWQKTRGTGGYDMGVLKLTNSAVAGPKPKLFINSAIHAREYATAPLVLEFARWLVTGHGTNADATWILDHHEVHLMLQANPDGRKKAEAGASWRKNINSAYCGRSTTSRGADLNRNFTFGWNSTNGQGSSGNTCSETYRGPTAGSEPETQAVESYIRNLWPDRRGPLRTDAAPSDTSGIHLDIHSYSQLVLWPWGSVADVAPNGAALQTLGRRFAFFNGYTPMQSIGLYPTDGTSEGPSYGELGVPAYTFELGTSFFQSCTDFNNTIKPNNLPALIYAAKVVRAPYLTPGGPDVTALALAGDASGAGVAAGTPVGLSASVTDTRFNQSNGSEPVQAIAGALAWIDTPPWAAGAVAIPLSATDGGFNSSTEAVAGTLDTSGLSAGKHIVYVSGTDASGQAGPLSAVFLNIAGGPPPITLALTATPRRANQFWVDLTWGGATGANVDVIRNGVLATSTANDGTYRESRQRGTWRYKVCQSGSSTVCSAEMSITF